MKPIFTIVLIFISCFIFAQNAQLQLISSGGARFVNANIEVNTSIGETVIGTFESNGIVISNGFNQPAPKMIYAFSKGNVSCFGASDTWAKVTVTYGEAPFTYQWSNGGTADMISDVSAGKYYVTITDATSQKQIDSVIITEPTLLATTTSTTDISCNSSNNGSASVLPVGGTTPYSYLWNNTAGSTSSTISSLTSGTYIVTVTDSHGCTNSKNVAVNWVGPCNTKVRTADCGIVASSLATYIYCDVVSGADNYEWEFVNAASNFSFPRLRGSGNTGFYLNWVTGIEYGKTYDVRVRAYKNGVWGSYSSTCQITSPAIPTTQLTSAYCGNTVSNLTQYIYCNAVALAADYEWEFTNAASGFSFTRIRGGTIVSNSMSLSLITGLEYATTYNVRVRTKVGTEWGVFGSPCTITTPAVPTTQLQLAYRGSTVLSLSHYFYCDVVIGASDYEWKFTENGNTTTVVREAALVGNSMNFSFGAKFNTTYDVSLRVRIGTQWSSYALSYTISTPGISPTKVRADYCGTTVALLAQYVYCDAVKGATNYEWKFENAASSFSFTKTRETSNTGMYLPWITGITNGKIYDVSVRAMVNGVWGSFGNVCTITTPAIGRIINEENQKGTAEEQAISDVQNVNVELSLMPNPVRKGNTFFVNMLSNLNINDCKVSIHNILGQVVYTTQLNIDANNYILGIEQNEKFSSGLHIIQTEINGKINILKLVIE